MGVHRVARDELTDAWGHQPAVFGDVPDEVPGDPVIDTDCVVLAASVPEPPLHDAPQARPGAGRDLSVRGLDAGATRESGKAPG